MKNNLKMTLATALALFVLAGCCFSGDYEASEAVTLSPEEDLTITEAGVYLLSGTYTDMIVVDAGEEAKV